MAIPSTPINFYVQTGNITNYISADLSAGATSYSVQRSLDGITFTIIATPPTPTFLDDTVSVGIEYWYQIAAVNTDGVSVYTPAQSAIPAQTSEMALKSLRLACQQKADRVNSQFLTLPEWNTYINLAQYELYDLLITAYDDYFLADPVTFYTAGTGTAYPLPNGIQTFQDASGSTIVAPPLYKLNGVDFGLNASSNAYATVVKFNWSQRNQYQYPQGGSNIFQGYDLKYRMMGDKIRFQTAPAPNQPVRLWYIPRLPTMLADTDMTSTSISGWIEYVIVRAAKYALDKEESDTSKLDAELLFLKKRIEETAPSRDVQGTDTISDTRNNNNFGDNGSGFHGGW